MRVMTYYIIWTGKIFLCLLLGLVYSCGNLSEESSSMDVDTSRGSVVSVAPDSFPLSFMSGVVSQVNSSKPGVLNSIGLSAKYEVNQYNIIYNTIDPKGNKIKATATLLIPSSNTGLNLVVYLHGTETKDNNAPSKIYIDFSNYDGANSSTIDHNLTADRGESLINTIAASTGYAVLMPNYIGLGMDGDGLHPYMHGKSLGTSTIDAIRAAYNYADSKTTSFTFSKKFVLAGYSEGGYATMATHKELITEADTTIDSTKNLKAVFPGGAPVDLSKVMANEMLTRVGYKIPAFAAYILLSYNSIYGLYSDVATEAFKSYSGVVSDFDGTKTMGEINTILFQKNSFLLTPPNYGTTIQIFTTALQNDILNGYQAYVTDGNRANIDLVPLGSPVYKRIVENDVYDLDTGKTPYFFMHEVKDEIVPSVSVTGIIEKNENATFVSLGVTDVPNSSKGETYHSLGGANYIIKLYGYLNNPSLNFWK